MDTKFSKIWSFLTNLKENNNRDWFQENKSAYEEAHQLAKDFFNEVYQKIEQIDAVEPLKVYRIYRDVRFSKDKTPYKTHFSCFIGRQKPNERGGFYIHLEPELSFIGGGFWGPEPKDLLRIRQEFLWDDEIVDILNHKDLKGFFGDLIGEELKTAPKGFDKNHERIDLIRKKQFLFTKKFSNAEVENSQWINEIQKGYELLLPFYHYMTSVLTTNSNGE